MKMPCPDGPYSCLQAWICKKFVFGIPEHCFSEFSVLKWPTCFKTTVSLYQTTSCSIMLLIRIMPEIDFVCSNRLCQNVQTLLGVAVTSIKCGKREGASQAQLVISHFCRHICPICRACTFGRILYIFHWQANMIRVQANKLWIYIEKIKLNQNPCVSLFMHLV